MDSNADLSESRELAQATRIANDAHTLAEALIIRSASDLQVAGTELRALSARRKDLDELRLSLTRPLDESKRRIIEMFRPPTERLAEAEGMLRRGVSDYQRAENARLEAERRAAEAAQQAERDRLRREQEAAEAEARKLARKKDDASRAAADAARQRAEESRQQLLEAEVAPTVLTLAPAPKAEGISTRKLWHYHVEDLGKLIEAAATTPMLRSFLKADDAALGQAARALKGNAKIPGVRVYAEDSLSVRR